MIKIEIEMIKKTEKPINQKKNWKNQTVKKKPIRILKKPTSSVRFYKPETEKIKPNPNWKN
jgi:hypothetical protein